jgi:4,5:9,10-diseco-3-hydroxy-5,9,17-trioxoandrosta-1(10),2-diene-4-oate hydrolase
VLAPDLPGFGAEDRSLGDYSPAGMAGFLGAFLEAMGLRSAVFVGNSLGGRAVLDLALAAPARVSALVLVDGAGLGRWIDLDSRIQTLPGVGEALSLLAMFPPVFPLRMLGRIGIAFGNPWRVPFGWLADQVRLASCPEYYWNALAAAREQVDLQGQKVDYFERLPELSVPTLLIWGALDRILPAAQAATAVERLPRGRLVVIPGCGHMPHLECPARFVQEVGDWLGREPAAR